ncbi:Uncharacterised protein [uncultured archaeon]|nr:Uncharacterised protein [uncultured archaeon]
MELFVKTEVRHLKSDKTIVRLKANTTWRCGKLQRDIITFVKKHCMFHDVTVDEINKEFQKSDEVKDALKRLQKRNIIVFIK